MIRHRLFATALTSALALAACGDNNPGTDADVDAGPDIDAGPDVDAPVTPDAPAPFVAPTPVSLGLSAAGPDQLMAAISGPAGSFYAAGYVAADLAGAKAVVVVKLTAAGALDTTFGGGDGIASTGLVFKGGSGEIELAAQSTGAIVVATTVAHAGIANPDDAADTDIALTRLDATGVVDATFGTLGVATLDLNDSILDTTPDPDVVRGRDGVRSIAIGPSDQIFVHAVQRAEGNIVPQSGAPAPRIDTEFAVLRLTAGGTLDVTYGTSGKHLLDIYAQATHSNATPHGILVNSDGTVIANGYAASAATGNTVQPVLYKVNAAGTALVTGFAQGGLFHEEVLAAQTEIYGVALHGTTLITGGYGRANTASTNDFVSMKFDAATGVRDPAFGGATLGAVTVDPSGLTLADNCRGALALPSGSTVMFGSVGAAGVRDATMAVLTGAGALDTAFGDGTHTFDFASGTEDQLWGGAVSGGKVLLVGWRGVGTAATATSNDDATVLLFDAP